MKLSDSQRRNLLIAMLYDCSAINGNTWTSLRERELIMPPTDDKGAPIYNDCAKWVLTPAGKAVATAELQARMLMRGIKP